MRVVLLLAITLVVSAAKPAAGPVHRCTHVSRGFRACTTFFQQKEHSGIYRRTSGGWAKVVGGLSGQTGWWRRVVAPTGRATLLAQWSGECEAQSTYFVSASTGRIRPIFRGHPSTIAGWTHPGLARVRLSEAIWRGMVMLHRPGVYLVDPGTMAVRLQLEKPAKRGC